MTKCDIGQTQYALYLPLIDGERVSPIFLSLCRQTRKPDRQPTEQD